MNALVVGGTSGLGLTLAQLLKGEYQVSVTGRRDSKTQGLRFLRLDLSADKGLPEALDALVGQLSSIDLLVYAAGFYQEGRIDEVSDADIAAMDNVGLRAPMMLLQRLLKKQGALSGFIAITSTSQFTPRLREPTYTAVKAGLAMLASSVAQDERIGKTLVVAPGGMKTKFWEGTDKDTSTMLDPKWVAEQTLGLFGDDFRYREAHILREPPRVDVVEER